MFRAVFETAVERAEENPGLVDSEDINTTLHPPPAVAGIFYLLLGRSAPSGHHHTSFDSFRRKLCPGERSTRAAGQGRGLGLSSSGLYYQSYSYQSSSPSSPSPHSTNPSSKTLTKNIKNQFGSKSYFDAVLVYFNNNQGDGVIIIKGRDLQE
ncbi:hypothetical protein BY996DRAFT_6528708 [Phakopsora pachyrhizi]|nr:hypothetical protein BY996DRAFT_6528708 [Phakopsora pachyrhizi]